MGKLKYKYLRHWNISNLKIIILRRKMTNVQIRNERRGNSIRLVAFFSKIIKFHKLIDCFE